MGAGLARPGFPILIEHKQLITRKQVSRAEMLIFDQALPQVAKRNRELFDRLVNSAHAITMIILDALSKM